MPPGLTNLSPLARSPHAETDEARLGGERVVVRRLILPPGIDSSWLRTAVAAAEAVQEAGIMGCAEMLRISATHTAAEVVTRFEGREDLAERLRAGAIAPDVLARIGQEIAAILIALDANGLRHGALRATKVRLSDEEVTLVGLGIDRVIDEVRNLGVGADGARAFLRPMQAGPSDAYLLGALLKTALLDVTVDAQSWASRTLIERLAEDALDEGRRAADRLRELHAGLAAAALHAETSGEVSTSQVDTPKVALVAPKIPTPVVVAAPAPKLGGRGRNIAALIGVDEPEPERGPRRPTEAIGLDQLKAQAALEMPSAVPLPRGESELRTFGYDMSRIDLPGGFALRAAASAPDTRSMEILPTYIRGSTPPPSASDTPLLPTPALPGGAAEPTPTPRAALLREERSDPRASAGLGSPIAASTRSSPAPPPRDSLPARAKTPLLAWIALGTLVVAVVGLPLGWLVGRRLGDDESRIVIGIDPPREQPSLSPTPSPIGPVGAVSASATPRPSPEESPVVEEEPPRPEPSPTRRPTPRPSPSPRPVASATPRPHGRAAGAWRADLDRLGLVAADVAAIDPERVLRSCYEGNCANPEAAAQLAGRAHLDAGVARSRANRLLGRLKQRSSELPIERVAKLEHAYFELRGLIDKFPEASDRFWRDAADFERALSD
ncbi:MAG: hypothetical protein U1E65_34640 [Myxococcota bacterium]